MKTFDSEAGADLKTVFDHLVTEWPDVTATTMFGCPSYKADDTLFAVLVTDGVALTRLPDGQREDLATKFETGPFDANGRTVTKWVQAEVDDPAALETLEPYVRASYETALAE